MHFIRGNVKNYQRKVHRAAYSTTFHKAVSFRTFSHALNFKATLCYIFSNLSHTSEKVCLTKRIERGIRDVCPHKLSRLGPRQGWRKRGRMGLYPLLFFLGGLAPHFHINNIT